MSDGPEHEYRDPRFAELDRLIGAEKHESRTGNAEPPKEPQARKKRRSRPLPRDYRKEITRIAIEHRRMFKPLLTADPTLKDRAARFYRSLLLLKPKRRGRPPIGSVTKTVRLLKKFGRQCPDEKPEKHWGRVYPLVIPGYGEMRDDERRHEREQLRERVRWRRRRRHRTNKATD